MILSISLAFGISFFSQLNGCYAFSLYDSAYDALLLVRDFIGSKPLFYQFNDSICVFASEPKALFSYGIKPEISLESFAEIFGLGPARTPGHGIYVDMKEVLPGHCVIMKHHTIENICYTKIIGEEHTDSYSETVEKTAFLIEDSIQRQLKSDGSICSLLSGGIGSSHHYLECDSQVQLEYLEKAVDARDLPCMADIESSLLYFCGQVASTHKVALTGECADEIFGGYPWFYKEDMWSDNLFPWSNDLAPRTFLLRSEFVEAIELNQYVENTYHSALSTTPYLEGENPIEKKRREIAWLNISWFMVTLLNRMDRCASYYGLDARIPFADRRIVQYIFNTPWEMKYHNHFVKNLLIETGVSLLPNEVLHRKKSPYPKTYDPAYEKMLRKNLLSVLDDSSSPLYSIINRDTVFTFLNTPSDYGKPWYGQLMAGPQMMAYLLQIDYWMKKYHLSF